MLLYWCVSLQAIWCCCSFWASFEPVCFAWIRMTPNPILLTNSILSSNKPKKGRIHPFLGIWNQKRTLNSLTNFTTNQPTYRGYNVPCMPCWPRNGLCGKPWIEFKNRQCKKCWELRKARWTPEVKKIYPKQLGISHWKLGSMVRINWVISPSYLYMGYFRVIIHLLTIYRRPRTLKKVGPEPIRYKYEGMRTPK